ncbi:MAG: penicillin-binding protein 2 [Gammaproteobacteria bacterium]|nr:MAG: penicillin-binding protein 2 [Gammaproteobacteria bacterium]
MAPRIRFKDPWQEQRLFFGRLIAAAVVILLLTGLLVARLVQLQVVNHPHFADLSQDNRIRIEPVPPTRGLIYDRHGQILAENLPAYQLELIPEQVEDMPATLAALAELGLIPPGDIDRILALARRQRRFEPVTLNFRMDDEQVATFAVRRQHFPGVDIRARLRRHYPFGAATAHTVGYVGGLSARDLERLDRANYAGTSQVGKTGVEFAYEHLLHGQVGYRQVVVNARGRVLERLETPAERPAAPDGRRTSRRPVPGQDVVLGLDIHLQLAALEALGARRGAVVVLDTRDGDVLAMASTPGFDPNLFSTGISQADYQALLRDPDNPLFDRALRGIYPPGSTIKPQMALALLHHRVVGPGERLFCPGHFRLPGSSHRFRDWRREGHGHVDLIEAMAQSCDVYFYAHGSTLGIDRMHEFLTAVGLGERTGIDIQGERPGLVPSREWKRGAFRQREDQAWFPGETVIAAIGQGYMNATMLQLAHSTAVLAQRGVRTQPRLAIASSDPLNGELIELPSVERSRVILEDERQWDLIRDSMIAVTRGARGTARLQMRGTSYLVAGKTGTAQVFSVGQDEEYDADAIDERLRDHALFVAFAPAEAPEISIAVIVENGGSGSSVAAPVARAVMDRYFATRER